MSFITDIILTPS